MPSRNPSTGSGAATRPEAAASVRVAFNSVMNKYTNSYAIVRGTVCTNESLAIFQSDLRERKREY